MESKSRIIYVLRYLWENTDDEHHTTITDILSYLDSIGISANRRTISSDIEQLCNCGFDILCDKSTQNRYHIGCRTYELAELKLLVDAVQSSRLITKSKSKALIEKLYSLTSKYEATLLNRNLYVDKRIKPINEAVMYSVDLINDAINKQKKISFSYYMYNSDKQKILKHNGKCYVFSPFDLVWNEDSYYVIGCSDSHDTVLKFRVDRIHNAEMLHDTARSEPDGYNIDLLSKQVFSMYDGKMYTVQLKCNNDLMNTIVDRFGEDVKTEKCDDMHFIATADISASPTFYGWLFIFAGRIKVECQHRTGQKSEGQINNTENC